jgi:hypothetical protein
MMLGNVQVHRADDLVDESAAARRRHTEHGDGAHLQCCGDD